MEPKSRGPGRPPNRYKKTPPVVFAATPKLHAYLEDLKQEEGYGNDHGAVARTLVWRGIEDLIDKGVLDRRKGPWQEAK